MNNKSSDRQKKLFLDQPIIKSILLVSLPALAMAIMTALYIFADQLMMVNLIPKVHTNQEMFGSNWPAYEAIINSPQYSFVSQCSVASVVRTATAYSTPATLLINASTLLIGNGTAIKFNNFSGKKEFGKAQKVYQRGFYSNLFLSMLLTVFVLMFSYV
jgi:Na+-driven multidrug efflux pump